MLKKTIKQQLLDHLKRDLSKAKAAAQNAHLAATDDQSVAETQYDTLAIEAAYLAEGHSRRVLALELDIQHVDNMSIDVNQHVMLGSLVKLSAQHHTWYFIAPAGAGLQLELDNQKISVMTPQAPIAIALMHKEINDDIYFELGNKVIEDEITEIL